MVTPLRAMAPGDADPSPGGASGSQPGLGGSGDDVIFVREAPGPTPPTRAAQGGQTEPVLAWSAEGEPAAGAEVAVQVPPSWRAGKAASEPHKAASEPRPAVGSSSSARDAEAASATSGWTPGRGTAVVNIAAQDVRTRLQNQAATLRQFTDEFLATRAAIRDYHNLRAAAFNSQARKLTQKTADLTESRAANASLRAQLGKSQTALRAKDAELAALVQERDRLVKKLADQEESHKAALKAAQDREAALQAEFETEAAA
ncbi:uncharacterized protein [Aegilops tauschii subsp. strangulata]|uniref:uncharacterized protein n=1 Tax=Aegilops tauschii subsp. strangulata TaxID=200361 RepID=UPI003CC86694